MKETILMTPGPVQLSHEDMKLMTIPLIHHRSVEFGKYYFNAKEKLMKLVGLSEGDVAFLTASGTGAMEACVTNFVNLKSKVLVLDTGFFSQRFAEILLNYGVNPEVLSFDSAVDVKELLKFCNSCEKTYDVVYITHHDTSTGILNDVKMITAVIRQKFNPLIIVDSISSLVAHEMNMDNWNVDVVCGSSQKGFYLPPGLAFVLLNQRAIAALENEHITNYYFDLRKMLDYGEIGQTPTTPAISLIVALSIQLDKIMTHDIQEMYTLQLHRRKLLEHELINSEFKVLLKDEKSKGNVVVPILIPNNLNVKSIVEHMRNHGITIIGGYGKYANTTIRIGILGNISDHEIVETVNILKKIIEEK